MKCITWKRANYSSISGNAVSLVNVERSIPADSTTWFESILCTPTEQILCTVPPKFHDLRLGLLEYIRSRQQKIRMDNIANHSFNDRQDFIVNYIHKLSACHLSASVERNVK